MRMIWSAVLVLGACSGGDLAVRSVPEPSRQDRIAAECAVLEAAYQTALEQGNAAPPDIVVGCPGRETLRDTMPLRAQSEALRRANAAVLPAGIAAIGPRAEVIYRRMITRGVPESVAAGMAGGRLFRVAAGGAA